MSGVMDWLHDVDEKRVALAKRISSRWRGLPKEARTGVFIAFLVFLFLLPVFEWPIISTPGADWDSVLFYPVAITVLVAIGLNVVVGQAGLLDLGYVAFFAVGAYTVGVLGSEHGNVPWLICVPIGVIVAMVSGFLLGSPTLRLRGDYLAIVTLGFGEIVRIIAQNTEWLGGADGISNMPRPPDIGPLEFNVLDSTPYYWLALVVIMFVVFLMRRLERSRVGRAWTAIREDEDAAELMGVPTFKFKLWAFAIGAAVGGLSGTLYAGYVPAVTPDTFQIILSILFLAAVVLGGAGNLPGVILGGVIVAYLPERLRGAKFFGVEFKSEWRVFIFGAALIVMMIFRPQGILPSRQRAIELLETEHQADFPGLAGADIEEPLDLVGDPIGEGEP
jgi:branched-chain amino acid transport system permease protein